MNTTVSVIIPVHNRVTELREAVDSVLGQTYRDVEIIIVDDGSTDDTAAVVDELASHPEIQGLHIDNGGPGTAREAGRQLARGGFIQYLDSDDVIYPEKLSLQVAALEQHPDAGVAYCGTLYRMPDGSLQQDFPGKRTRETFHTMWPSFLASRWWSTLTPLYRRWVCDQVGPWSDLCQDEDWEYESRVASTGVAICQVQADLCEVRHHAGVRASGAGFAAIQRLQDRARARRLVFEQAQRAGLGVELAEMQHFARSTFLLSRQCGGAGMGHDAAMLYQLSRRAAGNRARTDHRLYGALATVMGWKSMGRLSHWLDGLRSS